MASRFLKAAIPQAQSVYTSMPLEFINQKIGLDQEKLDLTGAKLGELESQPFGLEKIQDEHGNVYEVPDFKNASKWSENFNNSVQEAVDTLYKNGDVNQAVGLISKLNKEYNSANSQEGILGRNKLRQEAYTKLHEGLSKVKNLPNSYWRSLPYLAELEKIKSDENYIPSNDVAYGEHVDRIERVNKAMSGTNDELWNMYANTDGNYIHTGKKYGISAEKVKQTFLSGLNSDTELQGDIDAQINYEYIKSNPNMEYEEYYNQRYNDIANELLNNAMKYKKSMGDMGLSADSHGVARTEYELNNPSLPINGLQGATKIPGRTFDEWSKSLNTKKQEIDQINQNTNDIGFDLIQTLGIKDPKMMVYLQQNRKQFSNSDGSLNIPNIEEFLGRKLSVNEIPTLENGLALYNESLSKQNDLIRQQNNIEQRVNNINQKFIKDKQSEVDKEFINNESLYKQMGINSSSELMNNILEARKNGQSGLTGLEKIQPTETNLTTGLNNADLLRGKANKFYEKFSGDLNDYYKNNATGDSYLVLDNASNTKGVGIYNKGMTDYFHANPQQLLTLKVDGSDMLVSDILKKNKVNLATIDPSRINVQMIGNPMMDGSTGIMITVNDAKSKKIVSIPASDNGISTGTRTQALNDSYFTLLQNPSLSVDSDNQQKTTLKLAKGNDVIGEELRSNEIYNLQPNEKVELKTNNGTPYIITRVPNGGYSLTTPGLSTPVTKLMDENSILETIGEIEYNKDAYRLSK